MPAKLVPETVLTQLSDVLSVWKERPDLKIERTGTDGAVTLITLAEVSDRYDKLTKKVADITEAERRLAVSKDERDDEAKDLSDIRTRGLSLIRGVFGPDSPKYQQAGGTRASERKPRTPKAKTPGA